MIEQRYMCIDASQLRPKCK